MSPAGQRPSHTHTRTLSHSHTPQHHSPTPQVLIGKSQTAGRIFFGYGATWVVQLVRMGVFVMALMPGFLQLVLYYVRSPIRGVRYGYNPRNFLDIYVPEGADPAAAASKKVLCQSAAIRIRQGSSIPSSRVRRGVLPR